MKKMNRLFLTALVVLAGFVGGCTTDETNDAAISLAGDAGYTAADATVAAGSTIKIKWTATSSIDMKYVTITENNTAIVGWNEKEIASASKSTYIDEASITIPSGTSLTYTIIIYDKDKTELVRKAIVITVAATVNLTSYTGKVLGDQSNSTTGSLFASSTGVVYIGSAINTTNGPTIDITYGLLGTSNNVPSVISGSERVSLGFTQPSAANNPSITKYISSSLDISTVTNAQLTAIDFTSATKTITVASGNTYAFKNAAGKIGLFKVTNLNTGATTGSITIDVKVQP